MRRLHNHSLTSPLQGAFYHPPGHTTRLMVFLKLVDGCTIYHMELVQGRRTPIRRTTESRHQQVIERHHQYKKYLGIYSSIVPMDTQSTMLGIAYCSYSTGRPIPDAWLHLHTSKQRNFFAYPNDVALLNAIAPRLLRESPLCEDRTLLDITNIIKSEPKWLSGFDGSLPSRILNHMYLGNLNHANNPDLLTQLGITQLLSVGEEVAWGDGAMDAWGPENVCVVKEVQDNGIDSLTNEFARCLEFIGEALLLSSDVQWLTGPPLVADRGRCSGTATLVHCRVGVSRSATICIVEVMRALGMNFPRAYLFVRARRLNVIIQPHLRFAYELLRWEESLQQSGSLKTPMKKELEWGEIAREIALMNRPYSK